MYFCFFQNVSDEPFLPVRNIWDDHRIEIDFLLQTLIFAEE